MRKIDLKREIGSSQWDVDRHTLNDYIREYNSIAVAHMRSCAALLASMNLETSESVREYSEFTIIMASLKRELGEF